MPSKTVDDDINGPLPRFDLRQLLIAGVFSALISGACLESLQRIHRPWIHPLMLLGIAGAGAVAAAICLCAVVSPTVRGSLERMSGWLQRPIVVTAPPLPALLPPIAFEIVAFLLYGKSIGIGYLCDDWGALEYAERNVIFTRGGIFWRPVVNTSFWIDNRLWGHRPAIWHVENVLVYGLSAYLVYRLTKAFAQSTGSNAAADFGGWCAGILFLVLPGHVEVVNWLCDRGDLYGTALILGGLLAYRHSRRTDRLGPFVLCAVCLALALLSKEAMVTLPIAVIIAEISRRRWGHAITLVAIESAYLLARSLSIGQFAGGYSTIYNTGMLGIAVIFHLICEFPFPVLPLILSVAFYSLRRTNEDRRRALLGFAVLTGLYCLALIPVSTMSPGPEGNRFVYHPSAFSCAGLGLAVAWLTRERRRVHIATALTATALAVIPLPRVVDIANRDWIRAGEFTRASIRNARAAGSPTILPGEQLDSIGRAYVWRNGSRYAVELGEH